MIKIILERKIMSINEETLFIITKLGIYGETIDNI
jgi:hypothetical protein